VAEDQATEDVPSRSGSPARKCLTPWSPINIQARAERVARYLAAAGTSADVAGADGPAGKSQVIDLDLFRGAWQPVLIVDNRR